MRIRTIAARALFLVFSVGACAAEPQQAEIDWLKATATPLATSEAGHGFEDLKPFGALIGDARIVSLGECTHGTREVFQMKHRLIEYLATQRGFTIFSIEANMPEAYRLNDYVLRGEGDPKALIAGMYFWTWRTEEVLAMVEWMREFNRSGKGRIEFTGFDMQTPDVAADIILDFLKKVDPERVREVEPLYRKLRKGAFRKGGGQQSFARAVGKFPVDPVKGKKIRFSGFIKTAGVEDGFAGLWWRADDPSGSVAFDNMQSRAIKGDTDWTSYAIELEIPETTVNVNFGALLVGRGQAWFDGLKVEIDGKEFDVSGVFDAGFEESAPRGFTTGGDGYAVAIDGGTAKLGKQSLRMASTGEKVEKPKEQALDLAAVSKSCGEIVSRLEARRDAYLKTSSPREVDWAIQNARVVHQCLQSETKEVSRDASMARNVKWILDHAPEGTKVVLWSHNGHAGRLVRGGEWSGMGSFLDVWYGKAQVIVGFAAGEGTYTAIVSGKGLRSDNRLQPPAKDSYEAYFRAASLPRFLLDLRKARPDDPASAWLTRAHDFRSIGALAMGEQFASTDLRGLYDGIIYLDQTTASRTLKPGDGPR